MERPVFAPAFFYDEVRSGFFVSEMMKRLWAAQLVVMYEIAKICERHDITWYADMGTLLGAVRHQGYIPWDDDFDISMKREDWERFYQYARAELPADYCLLSVREDPEYAYALGRVTNSHGIDTGAERMQTYHGCPYCVGVDVYPIDRLYKDPEREQERKRRAKAVAGLPALIQQYGAASEEVREELERIERDNHTELHLDERINRELRLLFEQISMECHDEDYEEVALMITWLVHDWANCPKECYDAQIELPFEGSVLKASAEYDKLLSIYYPNYRTVKRGGGAHGYPIYRPQEEILKEKIGRNPYRYTFDRDTLRAERRAPVLRERWREMARLLRKALGVCRSIRGDEAGETRYELLQGSQDIAITLGTSIEENCGQGKELVRTIEGYCDLLYEASELWGETIEAALSASVERIEAQLEQVLEAVGREVLFLPCRAEWWESMRPIYERFLADPESIVRLLPIAYYDKDFSGKVGEKHDESAFFRDMDGYMSIEEYDALRDRPGCIIMQVPYDEWSLALTVEERFYSSELVKKTDELWYVPCFTPDPPTSVKDKAYTAMTTLVEQPAMVNADRVVIGNEELRGFYLEKLKELTGEENAEYWEAKVVVL